MPIGSTGVLYFFTELDENVSENVKFGCLFSCDATDDAIALLRFNSGGKAILFQVGVTTVPYVTVKFLVVWA